MAWVRLDDHFDEHPKIAAVGPLGLALWAAGLAYCNRNLTDGFIPWASAQGLLTWSFLGPPESNGRRSLYQLATTCGMEGDDVDSDMVIDLLLQAGLWEDADGGYRVHDYDQYQLTKAAILAATAQKAASGRAGGLASAQARAEASAKARAQAESKPNPNPNPNPEAQTLDIDGERAAELFKETWRFEPPPERIIGYRRTFPRLNLSAEFEGMLEYHWKQSSDGTRTRIKRKYPKDLGSPWQHITGWLKRSDDRLPREAPVSEDPDPAPDLYDVKYRTDEGLQDPIAWEKDVAAWQKRNPDKT